MNWLQKTFAYIRARLNERSTWVMIGASVAASAALASPWSYVAVAVGVIGALVPDGPVKAAKEGCE
jgi:hypothetical protein